MKPGDILKDDSGRPVKVVGFGTGTWGPLVMLERQDRMHREHLEICRAKEEVDHYPVWVAP